MKLQTKDIVDVIAPSSAPENSSWKKGVRILESWGLKVRVPSQMLKPHLFHSHKDENRLKFFKKAFSSSSKAVWVMRGGYGAQKLLPYVKKTDIKKKLFVGFSDATAIHLFLNNNKKIPSLHAPSLGDLASLSQKDLQLLKETLFGKKELSFPLNPLNSYKSQSLQAPIIGGNLTLLQSSLAVPWFQSLPSCFLFLEDTNEKPYQIDRMLYHLQFSGILKKVRAILIGSFYPLTNSHLKNFLIPFSKNFKKPILLGMPCGHGSKKAPLPLNTSAKVFISKGKAQIKIKGL